MYTENLVCVAYNTFSEIILIQFVNTSTFFFVVHRHHRVSPDDTLFFVVVHFKSIDDIVRFYFQIDYFIYLHLVAATPTYLSYIDILIMFQQNIGQSCNRVIYNLIYCIYVSCEQNGNILLQIGIGNKSLVTVELR